MASYDALARRLRNAYSGEVIAPLRDGLAPLDIDGAYAVQEINTQFWENKGRELVGRKAGLTSRVVQRQLGVNQPDFGALFRDMHIANGGLLSPARTIQPKVEAEIAFVLKDDLAATSSSVEDLASAVASVHAAIEIVDSRIRNWEITFADTVADNGSSSFFVLSDESKPIMDLDLYSAGMVLEINGEIASTGVGAAVLGHPLKAAVWLANILAGRGRHLRAGDIVLAGALGPMVTLTTGDRVRAVVGGVGECSFTFGAA